MERLRYARKIEHWGYPFGVMAYYHGDDGWLSDLYGPFLSHEEAERVIDYLIVHGPMYESHVVVKIETPEASRNRDPRDDLPPAKKEG